MIVVLELPGDLGAYAEGRVLLGLTRAVSAGAAGGRQILVDLGQRVADRLGEVMEQTDAVQALRGLREAEENLDSLAREAWRLLGARLLSPSVFDDLLKAAARCRSEIAPLMARIRDRAWARLQRRTP